MNHVRYVKTRNGKIEYKYIGASIASELSAIDGFVRGAFNMAHECVLKLSRLDAQTSENFERIFGEVSSDPFLK